MGKGISGVFRGVVTPRLAAAHASGNSNPRRGGMFIANDVPKNISQPHRGGTRLRRTIHAAPLGLGTIIGLDGCYKHGAPTELGLDRLPWSGQSPRRPKSLDRMTRSAVSRMFQFGRPRRAPRHRSALRYRAGSSCTVRICQGLNAIGLVIARALRPNRSTASIRALPLPDAIVASPLRPWYS